MLSVNHSARMDPVILQAKQMVDAGACGEVLGVDFMRSSDYPGYAGGPVVPPPYRTAWYPFEDLGVHGISIMETFLGDAPPYPLLSVPVACGTVGGVAAAAGCTGLIILRRRWQRAQPEEAALLGE